MESSVVAPAIVIAVTDECSEQWRDVLAVDGRGAVLQVAAAGGWDALAVYLETIKGKGVKS